MTSADLVYVLGTGRSGSTLVGNILGETPGAFCAGELRFLWRRGFVENRYCGCGLRFLECPIWSEIAGSLDLRTAPDQLAAISDRIVRVRNLPALLQGSSAREPEVADLLAHTARAYDALATVTGAEVVIDTSKSPAYALLLEAAGVGPTTYLHLVRDPRAAAWSWGRSRPSHALADDAEPMDRFPPGKSAALWLLWNSLSTARFRHADRYVFARYEDLTSRPREQIAELAAAAGLRAVDDGVFVDHDAVVSGPEPHRGREPRAPSSGSDRHRR